MFLGRGCYADHNAWAFQQAHAPRSITPPKNFDVPSKHFCPGRNLQNRKCGNIIDPKAFVLLLCPHCGLSFCGPQCVLRSAEHHARQCCPNVAPEARWPQWYMGHAICDTLLHRPRRELVEFVQRAHQLRNWDTRRLRPEFKYKPLGRILRRANQIASHLFPPHTRPLNLLSGPDGKVAIRSRSTPEGWREKFGGTGLAANLNDDEFRAYLGSLRWLMARLSNGGPGERGSRYQIGFGDAWNVVHSEDINDDMDLWAWD